MKAATAIIGATALAATGVSGEVQKRQLQTTTAGSGAITDWPTAATKPKYFFDFSNPQACVKNDMGHEGKVVMDFMGKAKLHLKGGRAGFVCNRGWREDKFDHTKMAAAGVASKLTMAPGYHVNYTGPTTAGAAAAGGPDATCNEGITVNCESVNSGTVTYRCKAGYASSAAVLSATADATACMTNNCVITTGAPVCQQIDECTATGDGFAHKCNAHATCTDATPGYTCACKEHPNGNAELGGIASSYNWNYGAGCTDSTCTGATGTNNLGLVGTADDPHTVGAYINSAGTLFNAKANNEVAMVQKAVSYIGCAAHQCARMYTDSAIPNVPVSMPHSYNHSNWTNTTFWENCTADTALTTTPAPTLAPFQNCSNTTERFGFEPNCTDNHTDNLRMLGEARRLSGSNASANASSPSASASAASPAAATGFGPNISVTLAPDHAFFRKAATTAGTDDGAKDVFNVLHFDGTQDYAEMEAGDMTAGHAIGARKFKGTPFSAALADDSAYATYPTDSKSGAAMDRIEGSADAGDAATFMFTFATNKDTAQGLLEGYGTDRVAGTNGQFGTFDFANISSGAAAFPEVNRMMNDLLQVSIGSQTVQVRAFGYASTAAADLNEHPLKTQINFVNYKSAANTLVAAAATGAETLAHYMTVFVTTGAAAQDGDVYVANSDAAAAIKSGKNCNYAPVCALDMPTAAPTPAPGAANSSRRLEMSPASANFQNAIAAKLRKLAAIKLDADGTCAPETNLAGNTAAVGAAGIPPIRRAHRLYALGRQQFTPDFAAKKEKNFGTCTDNCCCSAWQNTSMAGACGASETLAADKGNPSKLNFQHYKYFSGNMRNFGVWDKALTTVQMDDIMTKLNMATGAAASSAASSTAETIDEYWHQCRKVFNASSSCLGGNSSHTVAERLAHADTVSGCANTTECAEHSNSYLPVWNRNPAGASVACNIDQVKFQIQFKLSQNTTAAIATCIAAGTCTDAAGAAVDIPAAADMIALPGAAVHGFNLSTHIGNGLAKAIKYVLEQAENDAEGCTIADDAAFKLDEDSTDAVAETKTITATSGVCPKPFHGNDQATFTYASKNLWHFAALMNETDGVSEYGLGITDLSTVSTVSQAALEEAEQVTDNLDNFAAASAGINATTGVVTFSFSRKLAFTMKGVTDNVAKVIMESLEDEYYSDLIAPFLHHLKKEMFATPPAGLEMFAALTAGESLSGYVHNANITLQAGACSVTDSYGQTITANGMSGSSSGAAAAAGASGAAAGAADAAAAADAATTTTAAKKSSSDAFRASGASALASAFALGFALFFCRQ